MPTTFRAFFSHLLIHVVVSFANDKVRILCAITERYPIYPKLIYTDFVNCSSITPGFLPTRQLKWPDSRRPITLKIMNFLASTMSWHGCLAARSTTTRYSAPPHSTVFGVNQDPDTNIVCAAFCLFEIELFEEIILAAEHIHFCIRGPLSHITQSFPVTPRHYHAPRQPSLSLLSPLPSHHRITQLHGVEFFDHAPLNTPYNIHHCNVILSAPRTGPQLLGSGIVDEAALYTGTM